MDDVYTDTSTRAYLLRLALIVLFIGFLYGVNQIRTTLFSTGLQASIESQGVLTSSGSPRATPPNYVPPVPQLTADRTVAGIGSKTFAALVSYTNNGFEPASLTVHKGDTVRFTNNSTGPMKLQAKDIPPVVVVTTNSSSCAGDTFGTCTELSPGEYWEYTFSVSGDWSYQDALYGAQGVVHVK